MIGSSKHKFSRHTASRLIRTLLAGCLLAATIFTGARPAQAAPDSSSPLVPTSPVTGQAALDQLKASPDYPALVEAITAARYAIHPVADGSGLWTQNPANSFNATFTPQGVAVTAPGPALNPTEPNAAYRTRWQLTSLGYGTAQQAVAAGTLHYTGTRVELVRPSVTEWFVNGPAGLEHGFTLPTRPAANPHAAPLRLTLQVDGALTPQADGDGQQLTLHNAAGQVVLTYDRLKVWDATGTPLLAHLVTTGRQVQVVVDDAQARYPLTIDPTFSQQAYLKANNSGAGDNLGYSVAVSGDTVIVGVPGEASNATTVNGDGSNNSASGAGATYVFVRSGSSWSQQAYLKANNSGAFDQFGKSVAVSGDTIVVGSPYESSNATAVNGDGSNNSASGAGAAYVFVRSGNTWSQQAYLKANNSGGSDNFGWSAAVAGDTIVIGAPYEASNATTVNGDGSNNSFSGAGAAYVFVRSGTTWSQQAYLKANNSRGGAIFGSSVAVAGDTVVVGASQESSNAARAGAAYVFVRSGTMWSQQAYLNANNSGVADEFGTSVAVAGDTVVVGAYGEDSNATTVNGDGSNDSFSTAGAAYVFVRSGSSWSQQAYLKANNSGAGDQFGWSVAVAGDTVVVGAPYEASNATSVNGDGNNNNANLAGAAYVFVRSGSSWSQQAYLKANNSGSHDQFGFSVAVSSDTVVAGAPYEASNATTVNGNGSNDSANNAGAAYVFTLPTAPEIDVLGNNVSIVSGDSTPSASDHSDFGTVNVSSGTVVRTFTVQNTGAGALTLSDSPLVALSGANAGDFTVTTQPASSVAANGSTTFQITFDPNAVGVRTATVTIANTDSDEGSYTFVIQGTGTAAPEIDVQGNSVSITSGDSTPSTTDHSDFGSVNVSSSTVVRTFTVQNSGTGALSISTPTLSGTHAGDFAITSAPAASVAANGSTTFQVTFNPSAAGVRTATVTIANNDSDENPYTFTIQGTGTLSVPSLTIASTSLAASSGTIAVPVNFASDGAAVAAVGFSIDYEESCLTISNADANSDNIPDAISGLPSGFAATITHNGADSAAELDVSIFSNSFPFAALSSDTLFVIEFTVLPACVTNDGSTTDVTVDFAANPEPSFSDTTGNDLIGSATGGTITLRFNSAPTAITLNTSSVAENAANNTTVGTLSTTDPDAGDSHSYALAAGTNDNASFTLTGNTLKTAAAFDFETKSSYQVQIRTTDNGTPPLSYTQTLTITVANVNEAPTALALDISSVAENAPTGTTVGTFTTTDPDSGDSHSYALVSGSGDTDNDAFQITGNLLKTAAAFDFESKASYAIRVQTTDSGTLATATALTITITNVNEAPVAVADPADIYAAIFVGGQPTLFDVLANDTDVDGDPLSVGTLDLTGLAGTVVNNGTAVSYTAPNGYGSSSFHYQASDGALTSNSATATVTYVKNDGRGDCNANGKVTAADFIATYLEIFDNNDDLYNGDPAWWLTQSGDYAGSARGCDANASENGTAHTAESVSVADISCTVLVFFGDTSCTIPTAQSATATAATLSVPQVARTGEQVDMAITLDTAGNAVASVGFALVLAPNASFDPTDSNGDGVPDAVQLNVPAGITPNIGWNAARHRLEVAFFGTTVPLPTLSDGVLATVTLTAPEGSVGDSLVSLELVSLGNTAGQDVAVETQAGTTHKGSGSPIFLPFVLR